MLSRPFWRLAETKISAGLSRVTGAAELIEMAQYIIVDVDIEMEGCMCFDGASGQSEVGMAATMSTSSWAWASVPQGSILQCRSAFARVIVLAPTYGSIY